MRIGVALASMWTCCAFLSSEKPPRVALLGNSILYYNDLPRLLQRLHAREGKLRQDSCFRGGADLGTLFHRGNGMRRLFGRFRAGARSPEALLRRRRRWDFVVLQDHTQAPAREASRAASLASVVRDYAPLLERGRATPVFCETYGYEKRGKGPWDLGDVDEFSRRLQAGYAAYADALAAAAPDSPRPRVAPVAAAFLAVRDERPELWARLFQETDRYHPSSSGTLLVACVLHATLFGHPPSLDGVDDPAALFSDARYLDPERRPRPFPSAEEAKYLADVAGRVASPPGEALL